MTKQPGVMFATKLARLALLTLSSDLSAPTLMQSPSLSVSFPRSSVRLATHGNFRSLAVVQSAVHCFSLRMAQHRSRPQRC